MGRKKRVYEDDDGRTIADMSGVSRPNLMSFRPMGAEETPQPAAPKEEAPKADRPWEKDKNAMTREERNAYVWGALKASLLVGAAYVLGFGLFILLIIKLFL